MKEIIYTSSILTIILSLTVVSGWVDRDIWNEGAVEAALALPPYGQTYFMPIHSASKVAARLRSQEKKPHFTVKDVSLSVIAGQPLSMRLTSTTPATGWAPSRISTDQPMPVALLKKYFVQDGCNHPKVSITETLESTYFKL